MAYDFDGSAKYLTINSTLIDTSQPFAGAAAVYIDSNCTSTRILFSMDDTGSSPGVCWLNFGTKEYISKPPPASPWIHGYGWVRGTTATKSFTTNTGGDGGSAPAAGTFAMTSNAWFIVAFSMNSLTNRTVWMYRMGDLATGARVINTGSIGGWSILDTLDTKIGRSHDYSGSGSYYYAKNQIGWVAWWNNKLNSDDIYAMARGTPPSHIRQDYFAGSGGVWPLDSDNPIELSGLRSTMTKSGGCDVSSTRGTPIITPNGHLTVTNGPCAE